MVFDYYKYTFKHPDLLAQLLIWRSNLEHHMLVEITTQRECEDFDAPNYFVHVIFQKICSLIQILRKVAHYWLKRVEHYRRFRRIFT